jgi:hypothetical protein
MFIAAKRLCGSGARLVKEMRFDSIVVPTMDLAGNLFMTRIVLPGHFD